MLAKENDLDAARYLVEAGADRTQLILGILSREVSATRESKVVEQQLYEQVEEGLKVKAKELN